MNDLFLSVLVPGAACNNPLLDGGKLLVDVLRGSASAFGTGGGFCQGRGCHEVFHGLGLVSARPSSRGLQLGTHVYASS